VIFYHTKKALNLFFYTLNLGEVNFKNNSNPGNIMCYVLRGGTGNGCNHSELKHLASFTFYSMYSKLIWLYERNS